MRVDGFEYRGRTVELRGAVGLRSVWVDDVNRTPEILARGDVQLWRESARRIIDEEEEGPEFTQTVTTDTQGATKKPHPTKGSGLISAFDEALNKRKEKP
jgi:hypothetical protein